MEVKSSNYVYVKIASVYDEVLHEPSDVQCGSMSMQLEEERNK